MNEFSSHFSKPPDAALNEDDNMTVKASHLGPRNCKGCTLTDS